jgi:mannose-6-phosphate isomerase-like protein (cupin superfamily)
MSKHIDKPWGYEQIIELNDKYCVKILLVDPGQRLSLQYHEVKTETMFCISGRGSLIINGTSYPMETGATHTIKPQDVHRLTASKGSELMVLELSSPELDDVIRIEDDYKRAPIIEA